MFLPISISQAKEKHFPFSCQLRRWKEKCFSSPEFITKLFVALTNGLFVFTKCMSTFCLPSALVELKNSSYQFWRRKKEETTTSNLQNMWQNIWNLRTWGELATTITLYSIFFSQPQSPPRPNWTSASSQTMSTFWSCSMIARFFQLRSFHAFSSLRIR